MLCCICKEKEASVHYTKIDGDKMNKVDLCEDCAKSSGMNENTSFEIAASLLLGLGGPQPSASAPAGPEIRCPRCGFTQTDFKKAGRLGCPECYKTFAENLEGLLKSMHKGTRHVGKIPDAAHQTSDLSDRLKTLQKRLAKAISDENFEQAALLRDEIKQTSARLGNLATR